MAGSPLSRSPARWTVLALAVGARDLAGGTWRGSGPHRLTIAGPRPDGLGAAPRDFRPADLDAGRRILAGVLQLPGGTLSSTGDPFDAASPTRRCAVALHRFGWLHDLLATGIDGADEALRLELAWRRTFGRWNPFAWSAEVLERRLFNLACAAHPMGARASEAERAQIAGDLARQARFLLSLPGEARAAERACVAAIAGTALLGRVGRAIRVRALTRLDRALARTAPLAGGHASRSPQAALELLFDLQTLEDALAQHGLAASGEMLRAMDRLATAVRFFTLADGRLAAFHGGEPSPAAYVAAARAQDELEESATPSSCNGYQRLDGRMLQVIADAAPPPPDPWSVTACAQPLAIEVLAGARRLIVGCGWTPEIGGSQALRLVDAASTASLNDAACGEPLRGFPARVLGQRLADARLEVDAQRQAAEGALWLDLAHDGWAARFGLRHARRLFLDAENGELRGEDRFTPVPKRRAKATDGRRFVPFVVRFQLHPQVSAVVARDRRSVLLKVEGDETAWRLRNDAIDVVLEPSVYHQDGRAWRTQQVVLRGQVRLDTGARVRWKLSPAEAVDAPGAPA